MDPDARCDLDLNLSLQPPKPEPPGYFTCTYCDKKFCSPQAFGGHQNAHKFERSVTKRARELAAARRHDGLRGGERSTTADEQASRGKQEPAGIAAWGRALLQVTVSPKPEASPDNIAEDMDLSLKL
ncbi:hypothetical protein EJB05_31121, partial [Eragrostis curvula]